MAPSTDVEPSETPAAAPRQKPFTTVQVYGALAAIALAILVIVLSCAGAWLYYVQVRSDR